MPSELEAAAAGEADVVMTVSSQTDIKKLFSAWKPILKQHHLIIVVEEDYTQDHNEQQLSFQHQETLQDFDFEIFTKRDAEKFLDSIDSAASISSAATTYSGKFSRRAPSITLSSLLLNPFTGNACRSFGFLVSKARYVVSFVDNVVPASDSSSGALIDAVQQHLSNLRSRSTPYYFNTLYDPHRADSNVGFVRGYPFSLRLGVPTVVSHGLSLGLPDYDAPTAIVKPHERTLRYVDAIVTIPKGALYPMCGANVAFDRRLIGACMLLRSGIGVHDSFSASNSTNIDDVWAGLCAKVTADHLGYGVKSGLPYVWRGTDSASTNGGSHTAASALESLKSEFRPLLLLEDIIPFFQSLRLSKSATTAEDCYVEIARMVKAKLRGLDPSFERVAAAMETWVDAWKAVNSTS